MKEIKIDFRIIHKLREKCNSFKHKNQPQIIEEGWSISQFDLSGFLEIFEKLSLKEGYKLAAFQYYWNNDGSPIIFAIPKKRKVELPPDFNRTNSEIPLPKDYDTDFMKYIISDLSDDSYVQASLFKREIQEIGAFGHGRKWSNYDLISNIQHADLETLEFCIPKEFLGNDWSPLIIMKDHTVSFSFYIRTFFGQEKIFRITDLYNEADYNFTTTRALVATGKTGRKY